MSLETCFSYFVATALTFGATAQPVTQNTQAPEMKDLQISYEVSGMYQPIPHPDGVCLQYAGISIRGNVIQCESSCRRGAHTEEQVLNQSLKLFTRTLSLVESLDLLNLISPLVTSSLDPPLEVTSTSSPQDDLAATLTIATSAVNLEFQGRQSNLWVDRRIGAVISHLNDILTTFCK